ncbi:alpha/beta fold hydrolase [Streptomyces telluris]|uniref:Alpha/beta fold hydrolase n=1 Tax=Streptomyces telluris TaxID=2720021 RepID=A0A9X2RPS9_9ACTN|nr:alpha/beta fold hydrolase [Streptomyces telluris]MCQ8771796.1 alpha/beta fold hydrolase [Streptomyces telluris]NJP77291.1 alpha/beta fold hydrolase [Streptomyces telluris]
MGTQVSSFADDAARARILGAYDAAMAFWPEPRGQQDVATSFGSTRVHTYGGGPGTPVVLLHGQSATPAEWAPHVAALGEGRPVLAVDRVGEPGYSTQSAPITTAEETAIWLEEVLAGLGLERAHLVGHSYGGWVALNHAARKPARVASVAVYDPPRALAPLRAGFVLGAVASMVSGSEKFQRRWFTALIGDTGADPEEAEAQTHLSLEAMRGFRVRLLPPPRMSDEELRSVTAPALILLGGADRAMDSKRARERADRLIPDVRAEIVPGAGHGIPVKALNSRVPEFWREVEAAPGGHA